MSKGNRSLRKLAREADDRVLLVLLDRERDRARRSFLRWTRDEERGELVLDELRDRLRRRPLVLGEVSGAKSKAVPDGT
jgi:hypothetical protein